MIDEKNFMKFMAALRDSGAEHVSFDDLGKFIKEQPKIGEWIPCSERLPESDGMYLVTANVLKKPEVQYVWFQKDAELFVCNGTAIAWQPLPEPYHE